MEKKFSVGIIGAFFILATATYAANPAAPAAASAEEKREEAPPMPTAAPAMIKEAPAPAPAPVPAPAPTVNYRRNVKLAKTPQQEAANGLLEAVKAGNFTKQKNFLATVRLMAVTRLFCEAV